MKSLRYMRLVLTLLERREESRGTYNHKQNLIEPMDFASEQNKPIFICHPEHMYASCSAEVVSEALASHSAIRGRFVGRLLLKAAAARRLSRKALIGVSQAKPTLKC